MGLSDIKEKKALFKGDIWATPLFLFTSGEDKLNCLK